MYLPLSIVALRYHGGDGAEPVQSKFMPKHDEDLEGRGKKDTGESSWGQCASFRCSGEVKSTSIHFENSPFVPERAEPMHTE